MAETLLGISGFPTQNFDQHIHTFYPLVIALLERDLGGSVNAELRAGVCSFLKRVGEVKFGLSMGGGGGGRDGGGSPSGSAVTTPSVASPIPLVGGRGTSVFDWDRERERDRERDTAGASRRGRSK